MRIIERMLHPPGVGAAMTAPSCRSIDRFLGFSCGRAAGHVGAHQSSGILWGDDPDAISAPPPAAPAPPTSLERVLRLAARLLPCAGVNPGIARLERIASELRGVRAYYLHDPETCGAIDAWLDLWGSR
jgi:hypothetical protein